MTTEGSTRAAGKPPMGWHELSAPDPPCRIGLPAQVDASRSRVTRERTPMSVRCPTALLLSRAMTPNDDGHGHRVRPASVRCESRGRVEVSGQVGVTG